MFYDITPLLSRQSLLNFVLGERGVGKSYGFKKFVINDYLKRGNEFVYIRRYKDELTIACDSFFEQLTDNNEFEDHTLQVQVSKKKVTKFKCDGNVFGYAVPLTTASILKSATFGRVKTIVFDEFLICDPVHHYLRNEVIQFLETIETIARLRDVRIILLANASTEANPYFDFFNIKLDLKREFNTFKDGLITVQYIKNEQYRKAKRDTKFGRLIDGTEYGKYAIDNEFLLDDSSFIGPRSNNAVFYSTIVLRGHCYGVWLDRKAGEVFMCKAYDPSNPCIFTFTLADHKAGTIYAKARNSAWFIPVIEAFKQGKLTFEDQKIKHAFIDVIRRCMI